MEIKDLDCEILMIDRIEMDFIQDTLEAKKHHEQPLIFTVMKPLLIFHIFQRDFTGVKPGRWKLETTGYSGDGRIVRNDTLVMSRFDGGYFDYDGKPHYYLTDWQGNNIGVFDSNGSMEQQVDYYPYGEPRIEPVYSQKKNVNRYLFGGKERIVAGGINEYDFLARTYVASQCRFTTLDPLAEKTPWLSPYAYCAGNPVNFIDPDGRHTRVME